MKKDLTTLEDLLTDEEFLAAYDGRNGSRKTQWQEWIEWSEADPARTALMSQAIRLLTVIRLAEAPVAEYQTAIATRRLMQRIVRHEEESRLPPVRPQRLLRNFLIVAFRHLSRERAFSAINVLGLALGLAVCLLITLYVTEELGYDRFNTKADRIYRIHSDLSYNGNKSKGISTPAPMGPALVKDYPIVQQFVRFYGLHDILVKKGGTTIEEPGFAIADSTIFDIFTLPFITGNPHTALAMPGSLVVSREVAMKYFGTVNCLGKSMLLNNEREGTITGVMEDMPEQSHFRARILQPLLDYAESRSVNWLDNSCVTYVLLRPGATQADLDTCLSRLTNTRVLSAILKFFNGSTGKLFDNPDNYYRFRTMPLTGIHLDSHETQEMGVNGSRRYIYIFTTIAILILLMACVNFMNLSTARSARRAREVGIRKVLGSLRTELIVQFLTESMVTAFIAMLIAVVLTIAGLPYLSHLAGLDIPITYLVNGRIPLVLIATVLIVGLLAGLYPAFYLSAFRPVSVLKGRLTAGFRSGWLRNVLVVFQFTIAILLIFGTAVIYRQLSYIRHKDLGYNREQVLVIRNVASLWIHARHFKEEVEKMPGVLGATMTYFLPNEAPAGSNTFFRDQAMTSSQAVILSNWGIDADYVPTLGMTMTKGRNFSPEMPTDTSAILINETAAQLLDFDDPIGKTIYQPWDAGMSNGQSAPFHIIGVIKDFQPGSMHSKIPPMIFQLEEQRGGLAVRVTTDEIPPLIERIRKAFYSWDKMIGQPFPYYFMDETFDRLYRDDQRTGLLFMTFAGLAILIGILGLFGLITYAAEQRTREIGIRKVLGASPASIVRLLSKEFLVLTGISALIAFPLGGWAMQSWLNSFAYRTNMSWWIFAAAGALAIAITLITISFRALDAARTDPVKTLRHTG